MTTATPDSARRRTAAWPIVMRREIVVRLTDKAFIIGTLFTLAIIAAVMGFNVYAVTQGEDFRVGVSASDRPMAERAVSQGTLVDDLVKVSLVDVGTEAEATSQVKSEELDAWLHRDGAGWVLVTRDGSDALLGSLSQGMRTAALMDQAERLGTTPDQLLAESSVRPEQLVGEAENAGFAKAVGFAFSFLFYIAALVFGMQIASSVVEEKQSRIVEIIATAIPLRHLLGGKVAANTVLALGQMLLYAAVGLIGLSFTTYSQYLGLISGPVVWFLGFFVAGFIALACLWAVAGSLASRTEDLQSTTTPLTMVVLAVFFGSLFADGQLKTVLSFVPPISAVLMPMRILEGDVPVWQPVLALAILAVFALLTIRLGERLYRRSLLQSGGKLSIRQAWRAEV